jgi:protein-tyrosine phosphatase
VRRFVDVHSHVVPSGDDGVRSVRDGVALCLDAARRRTVVLYATPHVWPSLPLTDQRESAVRAAHAEMVGRAAAGGLELRLGWELTPFERLFEEDPRRYRLEGLAAVLMEVPFHGSLGLAERLGEHIEGSGLTPIIAHPERAEAVQADPRFCAACCERSWILQVNATSLLGYHGRSEMEAGWRLVESGLAELVASDGHRAARPPFLDEAYRLARERMGERATAVFEGGALRRLERLVRPDGLDLAQRG